MVRLAEQPNGDGHAHRGSALFPRLCVMCGIEFEPEPMAQRLSEARERGLEGEQQAADHANRAKSGWTNDAFVAVCAQARQLTAAFTFEELRLLIEGSLPPPPDLRAWGQVARRAIAAKVLRPTGNYAPRASGNCTPTMLYVCGSAEVRT